ncbi:polysaccharide deacetylase family protein [Rhodopila globiformis]|nr:polysaccharide deacetylase family protein [Rhodopila globiformis]
MKDGVKLALSCLYFVATRTQRIVLRMLGVAVPLPLVILYYHGISADSRHSFARQMSSLARWAKVVPADFRTSTALSSPTVAITFDDAFVSTFDYALPQLSARKFPCTIFVPCGNLGRRPGWPMENEAGCDEVVVTAARLRQQSLDPLVVLGSHGVTHPRFTEISSETARAELSDSRDIISGITGTDVRLFAFPYGDHDCGLIRVCQEVGYTHVFTIEPEPVDPQADAFVRGRVSVNPGDGRLVFFLKASGAYAWLVPISRLKRRNRASREDYVPYPEVI